jgi:hypothetical protein
MAKEIENPSAGGAGARKIVQLTTGNACEIKPSRTDIQASEVSRHVAGAVAIATIGTATFDLGVSHDDAREHGGAGIAPSTFDYGSLDAETAASIRATAGNIRERMKRNVVETGRDFIRVKAQLGHGAFGRWLKAEFEMTVRTAQNYMRAADLANRKSETVSHLSAKALYKLAAPSTPDAARDDVIARLQRGEVMTAERVDTAIRFARNEAAHARRHNMMTGNRRWKRLQKNMGPSPQILARLKKQSEQELSEKAAAQEAVALLRSLGAEFQRFRDLYDRASLVEFSKALRNAGDGDPSRPISIGLAHEAQP